MTETIGEIESETSTIVDRLKAVKTKVKLFEKLKGEIGLNIAAVNNKSSGKTNEK